MEYQIYKPKPEKEFNILGYSDNLLKPRNFYNTGIEESLEHVISKKELERDKGFSEKLFYGKAKTLKATIKALFN